MAATQDVMRSDEAQTYISGAHSGAPGHRRSWQDRPGRDRVKQGEGRRPAMGPRYDCVQTTKHEVVHNFPLPPS
jgi:hypothetical protein